MSKEPLFEPGVVPRPEAPAVKVIAPAPGVSLALADARSTVIVLGMEAAQVPFVELSLDGFRARPLATLPTPPKLGDLEAPGNAFEKGEHYLVASLRLEADAPARHAIARFQIGQPPGSYATPLVYCSRPEGTSYASPDAKLLLDFVTDGLQLDRDGAVQVRVFDPHEAGQVLRESFVESDEPLRFVALPGSEIAFELSLLDRHGHPFDARFAKDECRVTQNEVEP